MPRDVREGHMDEMTSISFHPRTDAARPVPAGGRRSHLARLAISLLLSVALTASLPLAALADVQAGDGIGNGTATVSSLALKVGNAPDVDAQCAILETADGTVLWSRNPDTSMAMASTTKIMTATLALEYGNLDQQVTISEEAASVGDSSAGLVAGSTTTLRNLLYGMMILSGNDAATQIAITVGGSVSNFVDMMNQKAQDLGMTNTHFENPHGLDADGHYTSPRDFCLLARYAMKKQAFRDIVGTQSITLDLGYGDTTIENTDELLKMVDGCIGIKTGTEDKAGYCLVSCVKRDDRELYSVILGSSDSWTRFTSAQSLLEWGFAHYIPVTLSDTTTVVAKVPHSQWTDVSVPLVCENARTVYVLDYDGAICSNVTLCTVKGDVHEGDALGTITWTQGDKVVATTRLLAAEDVPAPGFVDRVKVWFSRTFGDGPKQAEQEVLVDTVTIQDPASVKVS